MRGRRAAPNSGPQYLIGQGISVSSARGIERHNRAGRPWPFGCAEISGDGTKPEKHPHDGRSASADSGVAPLQVAHGIREVSEAALATTARPTLGPADRCASGGDGTRARRISWVSSNDHRISLGRIIDEQAHVLKGNSLLFDGRVHL